MEKNPRLPSKKRDPVAFEAQKVKIEALEEKARAGEIELAYLDEAGFSCVHPNRNAWTTVGEQHLIPATRGNRVNVLGALMSSGYLESDVFYGGMTSSRLVDFIKEVANKYDKPITFILDNASFHKSKVIKEAEGYFKKSGITLEFLPPYSPELNRIEKLWHTMKHHWMEIKERTSQVLLKEITHILENFGFQFRFHFYGK